jgi:purine-binding chemotaxis protein CheW
VGAFERTDALVCRAGTTLCALELGSVVETMRPLPLEALAGTPSFVVGLAIVRAVPTPVVDARILLGVSAERPAARWISLRLDGRGAALAVDEVLGVRHMEVARAAELPPLLGALNAERIASIAALDEGFALVLRHARLIPQDVLAIAGLA